MRLPALAAALLLATACSAASVAPAGVFPAGSPPGLLLGPGFFAAKKAAFLQKLFETLNATATPPPATAAVPSWLDLLDDADAPEAPEAEAEAENEASLPRVPLANAAAAAPIDPADKKAQFLSALFDSLGLPPPAAKPTIVPPGFWSPFAPAPPGAASAAPVPFAKPTIVPPGFWVPAGKPAPGALYKAKIATFLSKLFEQINATAAAAAPATEAPAPEVTRRRIRSIEEIPEFVEAPVDRRGLAGPFGGAFGGPFGGPFGSPFAPSKPFIGGPFGAGKPFAPPVDPQFFVDKKTSFLSQLFASKAAAPGAAADGPADTSSAPGYFGPYGFAPTPKPTIVPVGFWNPFPAAPGDAAAPAGPAGKPTIVPPSFWSPFAGAKSAAAAAPAAAPASLFADKKAKFLSALFAGLQAPATQPPPPPPPPPQEKAAADDDAALDSLLQELLE